VYVPHKTQSFLFARLMVRTTGGVAALAPRIRSELRTIDPDIPIVDMMTMDEQLARQRNDLKVIGAMFAIFAGVALVLAAVGLYAVTSHSVVQRTQEIGIRMALGAQAPQVRWLFFKRLFLYLAIGVTVGLAGAAGVGTLMRGILFGIGPYDPITLAGTAFVLSVIAVLACLVPMRRATRVDPMIALRDE
jgi:putative ABC transport system permease protein